MKPGMHASKTRKKIILDNSGVTRLNSICNKYNINIFILIICELKISMMILHSKSYAATILVSSVMFIC